MNCSIDGCESPIMYKSKKVCQKHYFRYMRYGTYELKNKNYGTGKRKKSKRKDGYVCIWAPDHPLAHKNGYVFEHRYVIYSVYGESLPDCEICGDESSWGARSTHIDHIDEVRDNNAIDNLRVLCNSCNVLRSSFDSGGVKGGHMIEHNGVSKPAEKWVCDLGLDITGPTLKNRIVKMGLTFEQAVSMKKHAKRKNK